MACGFEDGGAALRGRDIGRHLFHLDTMRVTNARGSGSECFRRTGVHHQIDPDRGKRIRTAIAKSLAGSAYNSGLSGNSKIKHSILLGFRAGGARPCRQRRLARMVAIGKFGHDLARQRQRQVTAFGK